MNKIEKLGILKNKFWNEYTKLADLIMDDQSRKYIKCKCCNGSGYLLFNQHKKKSNPNTEKEEE